MSMRSTTLGLLACLTAAAAGAAELRITIANVVPNKGDLLVTLFDRAQGFPDQPGTAQPSRKIKPDGSTVQLSFSNLAEGRWAVMVLQDFNGNGRADYNLVGLPKEPYGASNNRLPKLAPPKFEEALVDVGAQGAAVTIELRQP
ncbi:MAG: DUF2141 domain-containing protein [Aquabacterium sp.]|nr:DUF2141 domain-containing protein [Aquabacterium sp.]